MRKPKVTRDKIATTLISPACRPSPQQLKEAHTGIGMSVFASSGLETPPDRDGNIHREADDTHVVIGLMSVLEGGKPVTVANVVGTRGDVFWAIDHATEAIGSELLVITEIIGTTTEVIVIVGCVVAYCGGGLCVSVSVPNIRPLSLRMTSTMSVSTKTGWRGNSIVVGHLLVGSLDGGSIVYLHCSEIGGLGKLMVTDCSFGYAVYEVVKVVIRVAP